MFRFVAIVAVGLTAAAVVLVKVYDKGYQYGVEVATHRFNDCGHR